MSEYKSNHRTFAIIATGLNFTGFIIILLDAYFFGILERLL